MSNNLPLGRRVPTDWKHVEKYPLQALAAPEQPSKVPVVMGVNWYANFDRPEQDERGRWWIGRDPNLGHIRGGHAVTLKPRGVDDPEGWWLWYNQVSEGICVSEAVARCMSLLNRKRYQPRPCYDWAQNNDEWQGAEPDYSGTSVRAGLDYARTLGMVPAKRGEPHFVLKHQVNRVPLPEHGISANRWATSVDEVLHALGHPDRDYVDMLNSWGSGYPHVVRIPADTLDRLLREDGEFGIVTDR